MTVPPPPSGQRRMYKESSPVIELTTEDISAFIIPPPPGQHHDNMTHGHHDTGGNRELLELRLTHDQVTSRVSDKISPKIASLQERISQFSVGDKSKDLGLSLHKDKFGYPVHSPDQDTPEPSNVLKGQVQSKKEIFMKQLSSGELPPPPPPPRTSVPHNYSSHTLGRTRPASQHQMTRSNSQDDLVTSKTSQHQPRLQAS